MHVLDLTLVVLFFVFRTTSSTSAPTLSPEFPFPVVYEDNSRGCEYGRPNYSIMSNAEDRSYNNPRCSGDGAILTSSSFTNAGDGQWSEVCSTLCQDTPECRTFQKVFQSTTNYQCRLYRCTLGDSNFFFATGITQENDRAGWFNEASCYETGAPTTSPTPDPTLDPTPATTLSPTTDTAPTSQPSTSSPTNTRPTISPSIPIISDTNDRGCTFSRPDYAALSEAQDRQYNNPRCTGQTAILTSSSFSNTADGDWSDVCSGLCQDTPECRTFQRVTQNPTSNYQCRLYRCMPGDEIFFFATGITQELDRAGWLSDPSCYTTSPTQSPVAGGTPTSSTASPTVTGFPQTLEHTTTSGCTIRYPDYPAMSTAEDQDYAEVRCSGTTAIFESDRIQSGDWKDECTALCQQRTNCKSFTRIDVVGSSYKCRLYDCGPDDSNFFFADNQDATHRSGWFHSGCEITGAPTVPGQKPKPNILFFIADDMSPFSNGYLDDQHPLNGELPNIERIKQGGMTFMNAYTPFPVCGPTRSAFLTSRHPDTLKIYTFDKYLMQVDKDIQTIPKYFKDEEGYYTAGFGKVFHPHALGNTADGAVLAYELEGHWSQSLKAYHNDGNSECPDNQYYCAVNNGQDLTDYKIATQFINFLDEREAFPTTPWLAIVGFRRPHTNIALPSGYTNDIDGDLPIDLETTATDPPTTSLGYYQCDKVGNTRVPINSQWVNWIAGSRTTARDLADVQYSQTLEQMRKFYYASIKWVDEQLGRTLDALDSKGMTNNTIILFAGDHGWMIGEKKMFCKNVLFDIGVRVPLYVKAPGALQNQIATAPVSLLDIFPTLIDLAEGTDFDDGTSLPLEGVSFAPTLLTAREEQYAAYSQYPRCQGLGETQNRDCVRAQSYFNDGSCNDGVNRGRPPITYMGYSLRTKNYRYVEWREFVEVRDSCSKLTWEGLASSNTQLEINRWQINAEQSRTLWDRAPVEVELYDYSEEEHFSNFTEGPNLAPDTQYEALLAQFSEMIRRKFNSTEDPCNNRGHLYPENETCACIEPWTGQQCEIDPNDIPAPATGTPTTTAPTPQPIATIASEGISTTTVALGGVAVAGLGSFAGLSYAWFAGASQVARIPPVSVGERKRLLSKATSTLIH